MMKRLLYIFLLLGSMNFLVACEDEDEINLPKFEEAPQILPLINQEANRFNAANNWAKGTFSFTVDLDTRGVNVKAVEVYKTFSRSVSQPSGAAGASTRVLHESFTSWPFTLNVTAEEAVAGITFAGSPLTVARLNPVAPSATGTVTPTDNFIFTFEIVRTDDSRIIYTPLTSTGIISGPMVQRPYAAWAPVVNVP